MNGKGKQVCKPHKIQDDQKYKHFPIKSFQLKSNTEPTLQMS